MFPFEQCLHPPMLSLVHQTICSRKDTSFSINSKTHKKARQRSELKERERRTNRNGLINTIDRTEGGEQDRAAVKRHRLIEIILTSSNLFRGNMLQINK